MIMRLSLIRKTCCASALAISLAIADSALAQTVLRIDPALDAIIAVDAPIETLAQGFQWSEAPIWRKNGSYLVFSDVPAHTLHKWKDGEGLTTFFKSSQLPTSPTATRELEINGMTLDQAGVMTIADHGNRQVARLSDAPFAPLTIASTIAGKRFNSPNDLVFHSNGDLYFTDPPFGLRGGNSDPAKELDYNGVFRVSRSGEVSVIARDLSLPNGIVLSPDESTLYVSNADAKRPIWMSYPVRADGSVGEGEVFFDATALLAAGSRGVPDGMRVDRNGNVFATGPNGVLIISPDGKHLGTIITGRSTANCAFGDDGSSLYITAGSRLLRVKLKTVGARF